MFLVFIWLKVCRHTHMQTHICMYQQGFSETVWNMEEMQLQHLILLRRKGLRDLWDFTQHLCLRGMYRRYAGSSSTHPEMLDDLYDTQTHQKKIILFLFRFHPNMSSWQENINDFSHLWCKFEKLQLSDHWDMDNANEASVQYYESLIFWTVRCANSICLCGNV